MEAAIQNKNQRKPELNLAVKAERAKKAAKPQRMVPGKSLEQIRQEALAQLREMGLLF